MCPQPCIRGAFFGGGLLPISYQPSAVSYQVRARVVDNPNMESLTELRVRYAETDAMGIVHHATYPVWMELGRSDFLRELGQSYAEWEARGVRLVVNEIRVRFRSPARYDELVQVRTSIQEKGRRRIVFGYQHLDLARIHAMPLLTLFCIGVFARAVKPCRRRSAIP